MERNKAASFIRNSLNVCNSNLTNGERKSSFLECYMHPFCGFRDRKELSQNRWGGTLGHGKKRHSKPYCKIYYSISCYRPALRSVYTIFRTIRHEKTVVCPSYVILQRRMVSKNEHESAPSHRESSKSHPWHRGAYESWESDPYWRDGGRQWKSGKLAGCL